MWHFFKRFEITYHISPKLSVDYFKVTFLQPLTGSGFQHPRVCIPFRRKFSRFPKTSCRIWFQELDIHGVTYTSSRAEYGMRPHPLLDGIPEYLYPLDMELWENLTNQSLARNNSWLSCFFTDSSLRCRHSLSPWLAGQGQYRQMLMNETFPVRPLFIGLFPFSL